MLNQRRIKYLLQTGVNVADLEDAYYKVVLNGFADLDDARDYLNVFPLRDIVFFDAYGFVVTPLDLQEAIEFMERK